MRFIVAGGGVAGLAAALAVARSGHSAVVLERDKVPPRSTPAGAFDVERRGISHFLQPHAFLPRGRRVLRELAPDVHDDLISAGADPQDLRAKLHGPPEPGDEDLVYLWVRRPVIEWALRRAAVAEPAVELVAGVKVTGLITDDRGRARRVAVEGGARCSVTWWSTRSAAIAARRAGRAQPRSRSIRAHLLLPVLRAGRRRRPPRLATA